jgi:hypothetical protein
MAQNLPGAMGCFTHVNYIAVSEQDFIVSRLRRGRINFAPEGSRDPDEVQHVIRRHGD